MHRVVNDKYRQGVLAGPWIALAGFLVGMLSTGMAEAQTVSGEDEVRAVWRQFEAFYNDGDYEGVASLYRKDADRGISGSASFSLGREEIAKAYQRSIQNRAGRPIRATVRIRLLRPDVAILDGHLPAGTPDEPGISIFTVILTKDDGRWWIAAGRPRGVVPRP